MEKQKRDTVQFLSNVPVEVALKWPDGKMVSGIYGEQMMYSLVDGRVMFVDLQVGAKINTLEPQPGEPFWIVKQRPAGKGMSNVWKVWRQNPATPTPDTAPHESALERDLRHSLAMNTASGHGVLAVPKAADAASNGHANGNGHKPPAAPPASSNGHNPHVTVTDGRPQTKLENALKTVVAAAHAANLYAKEIGFQMPLWTSEDLRTMANTLIIDLQRQPK